MAATKTLTIGEFLLARIADDVLEANERWTTEYVDGGWSTEHVEHILAECKAKRAIVNLRDGIANDGERGIAARLTTPSILVTLDAALRELALVYADHPDCDPRWV